MLRKTVSDSKVKQQQGAKPGQNAKWTSELSPAGNSIKYFKRPWLTVKNHKIIKLSWRNEKRVIVFGKGEREQEPRATFPNEPSQIERSWLCSRLAWRGAGTCFL